MYWGPSWSWSYGSCISNYQYNQCLSLLMLWVRISIKAKCTTLCDKLCQWLPTGRWFSPGAPVSSTNKTDRHDITEILLKVALITIKQANKQTNKQTNKHILQFNSGLTNNILLQSSDFLVFYHFGFEITTLIRIIDFDDATNLFLKQVYSCAVVDACLIWTNLIILISRPVRWDKLYQSTHFKGKLHKIPINS